MCHNWCTQIIVPQGFIKAKKYPSNTKVEVMSEGGESAMFKHLFKSWKEKDQTQGLGKIHTVGKIGDSSFIIIFVRVFMFQYCFSIIVYSSYVFVYTSVIAAKVDQVKFDVMELHAQPKLAAQERMVDDASGHIQAWCNNNT